MPLFDFCNADSGFFAVKANGGNNTNTGNKNAV